MKSQVLSINGAVYEIIVPSTCMALLQVLSVLPEVLEDLQVSY